MAAASAVLSLNLLCFAQAIVLRKVAVVGAGASGTQCNRFGFLRIQKTGSTTFEQLIPLMTEGVRSFADKDALRKAWRLPLTHLSYTDIAEELPLECAVTFLRDPVERFLSEFNMLRGSNTAESAMLSEDQWDFAQDDLAWLDGIRKETNWTKALLDYLHYPGNPSRNRQALYILGFQRVSCRKGCCGVCVHDRNGGYPARAYDWDRHGAALLHKAKEHLSHLLAVGITDCFEESIRAIAPKFGWVTERAVFRVAHMHVRAAEPAQRPLQAQTKMKREFINVPASIRSQIRHHNRIDVELWTYAKANFEEIYNTTCSQQQ